MHQEIDDIVRMTANRLAKKWKQDRDDIAQELYLYIFEKLDYGFFDSSNEDSSSEEAEQELLEKLKRFKSSIYWAGVRYCMEEKAALEGYHPSDQYHYRIRQLQELLVIYLNAGIESSPPKGRAESVKRSVDNAERGGHLASMIDVERAYWNLSNDYRSRLEVRFGPLEDLSDESIVSLSQSEIRERTGWGPDRLQGVLGVTRDQVRARVDTALKALQKELGGPSPWRMGDYPSVA